MEKRVSVIVPVYNTKAYLKDCIESILEQTYKNLEVILVDDGSSDGSCTVLEEYAQKDSRIRLLFQENAGQGVARNRALDVVTGDYIAFVDSDDRIMPDMFESMVTAMEKEDCDISICGIRSISAYSGKQADSKTVSKVTVLEGESIMEAYVTGKIFTGMCDKIYRAHLFKDIRFPAIRSREDVYILHEVLGGAKRLCFLPFIGYVQNIRPGSTEQKAFNIQKAENTEAATRRRQAYVRANYPHLYPLVALSAAKDYHAVLKEILCRDNMIPRGGDYKKYREKLKNELAAVEKAALSPEMQAAYDKMREDSERPMQFYFGVFPGFVKEKIRNILKSLRK